MPRPRCTGPRCFFSHVEPSKNTHEAVLQALNRWMVFKNHQTNEDEQFFYATDNFVETADKWDTAPLIFAQEHPDPSLVKTNLQDALASVKTIDGQDGYICGSMTQSKVVVAGQPRLVTNVNFDSAALEARYNRGELALSSAFFCPNDDDGHLNGSVEPNHVLVFVQDEKNQPRDLGAGWWHNINDKTHSGANSGRYPKGSGGQSAGSGNESNRVKGSGLSPNYGRPVSEKGSGLSSETGRLSSIKDDLKDSEFDEDDVDRAMSNLDTAVSSVDATSDDIEVAKHFETVGYNTADTLFNSIQEENEADINLNSYGNDLGSFVKDAVSERSNDNIGVSAESAFLMGFNDRLSEASNTPEDDEEDYENKGDKRVISKSFIRRTIAFLQKIAGGVDDPSNIDGERPPVNYRNDSRVHQSPSGDGEDMATNDEKIKELDAKIKALQDERDALAKSNKANEDKVAEIAMANKALDESNKAMKATLEKIEADKQEAAWTNLRDTKIPRGWLVGENSEMVQKKEYTDNPVAYLNKILEHRKANPKEEVGQPFTNQGDANEGSDDAKLNAILSQKNHIPGRNH